MDYTDPIRRRARGLRQFATAASQPATLRAGTAVGAYWWVGLPNFGDDMTPWLLPKYGVVPVHRRAVEARLAGAGSILEHLPPDFDGAKNYLLSASPIISLGKAGPAARFSSRNDNISFALIDTGGLRAGANGMLVFRRDADDADELRGLDPIRFGGEVGGFAEIYPTD